MKVSSVMFHYLLDSKLPIVFKSFKIDYSVLFCHSDILYFYVNDNECKERT